MSVYKPARSPYYHYDFVWQGRRFHGSTGCRTKRDAERHEERVRAKARDGDGKRPPINVDDAAGLYQEKVEEKASWPTTRYILAAAIEGLGEHVLLSEVTQRDLELYVAKRRNGRANGSVNREIEVLRAMWRRADKARFDVGEMPDWGALMLKVPRRDPRELSIVEEDALLPEIRADLVDFCLFALKAGWRRGEVLGLRWSDLDLGNAVAVTKIKGGDIVKRPLTQEMIILLANQPKKGPFVFTYKAVRTRPALIDKKGRKQPARQKDERYPLTATVLRKPWAAAMKAANVENFRFHDLRHTRGTRILRATGNLAAAKAALAHRSIKTTLRYAHAADDDIRKALEVSDSRTIPEPNAGKSKKAQ
jgi:integrase